MSIFWRLFGIDTNTHCCLFIELYAYVTREAQKKRTENVITQINLQTHLCNHWLSLLLQYSIIVSLILGGPVCPYIIVCTPLLRTSLPLHHNSTTHKYRSCNRLSSYGICRHSIPRPQCTRPLHYTETLTNFDDFLDEILTRVHMLLKTLGTTHTNGIIWDRKPFPPPANFRKSKTCRCRVV